MIRSRFAIIAIIAVVGDVAGSIPLEAQDRSALASELIFHATFDDTTDANLFGDDDGGWIFTADSIERKQIRQGNHCDQVTIARAEGKFGDCLRFAAKTTQVLFYKAVPNDFYPRPNWSGTVSVWLKLDPDKDLEPGFCDPIQMTQRKWNDGAMWLDFDKELPRAMRLGVFSDFKIWNPENLEYDDIPAEQKPLVVVDRPPFANDQWTHVAFTFENVNGRNEKPGTAALYLNGQLAGKVQGNFRFTWNQDQPADTADPAIMIGLNYIGDMDDLAIFRRALTGKEIQMLYQQPRGIRGL